MDKPVTVSVVMPVYNEEKFLHRCLDSLLAQTFPAGEIEYILVDGGSTDRTHEIISKYAEKLPIRLLHNSKRKVTYALNMGIEEARGTYLIRMDAHAEYDAQYIEKCVFYLQTTDADNVGGLAETVGTGFVGEQNAQILSSRFGVGNSGFRTNAQSGYVDTVPFGAFRREIFDKIGKFDPELPRSEDNDFNSRIRAQGGKIYLANDIRFTYYCRQTVSGLLDQGIKNGNALFLTLRKNPKAMSLRHYVPFAFLMSLIIMPVLSCFFSVARWLFAAELMLYFVLDVCFSCSSKSLKAWLYKLFMYPLFHITYGAGSVLGLINIKLY